MFVLNIKCFALLQQMQNLYLKPELFDLGLLYN